MSSEESISEQRKNLENLGMELALNQYSFKIKETKSEQYWEQRIKEFENYHEKTIEYFMEAYNLIKMVDKNQSPPLLLRIGKLKQLGTKLLENMKTIKENPSMMDTKDAQQSKWSIQQREKLLEANEECKNHEKHLNIFFRETYEKIFKEGS